MFKLRVLKANGATALRDRQRDVRITIQHPSRYLTEPDVKLQGTGTRRDLKALLGAPARKTEATPNVNEESFVPPVDVRFIFPPQLGVKVADLRAARTSVRSTRPVNK